LASISAGISARPTDGVSKTPDMIANAAYFRKICVILTSFMLLGLVLELRQTMSYCDNIVASS
jgi:hypothetical protein